MASIPLIQDFKAARRASAWIVEVSITALRNALKHLENYAKVTNTHA